MNRKIGLAELDKHAERVSRDCDRLLTLAECAARTGHKVSTWRAWVLRRKVPYCKLGRSVRVRESDLEKMIEESRIPAEEAHHAT